jgi:hypothetical protein
MGARILTVITHPPIYGPELVCQWMCTVVENSDSKMNPIYTYQRSHCHHKRVFVQFLKNLFKHNYIGNIFPFSQETLSKTLNTNVHHLYNHEAPRHDLSTRLFARHSSNRPARLCQPGTQLEHTTYSSSMQSSSSSMILIFLTACAASPLTALLGTWMRMSDFCPVTAFTSPPLRSTL